MFAEENNFFPIVTPSKTSRNSKNPKRELKMHLNWKINLDAKQLLLADQQKQVAAFMLAQNSRF